MTLAEALERIRAEAKLADDKAEQACAQSHYSVQDYWMCIEFRMQSLHDRIAREAGLPDRCPHYPFRLRLNTFRKSLRQSTEQAPLFEVEEVGA